MKTYRKSSLTKIIGATRRNASQTMDRAIAKGRQVMDQLAAVRTGYMKSRNNGEVVTVDSKILGVLENDTPYGKFVEFGTRKMAAQPFFRPGVDTTTQEIKSGMRIVGR